MEGDIEPSSNIEELLFNTKLMNSEYAKSVETSTLTAENLFFVAVTAKECGSYDFLKHIYNRQGNNENEGKSLKYTLYYGKYSAAWMILQTWQNVENLDLSNCKLDTFPLIPIKVSNSLKEINLSGNNLEILPITISNYPNLKYVNLEGNPLSVYPEKCRTSWLKLREQLIILEKRTTYEKFRKLIIVGEEAVGKTTFVKCLQKKSNKTNCTSNISTDGINISDVILTDSSAVNQDHFDSSLPIHCRVWDFGGQEIYYQSHQFFLTSQSTYILCFDLTKPNIHRISYWLQQIQALSKIWRQYDIVNEEIQSESAIFLVGTHSDDKKCTPEYINDILSGVNNLVSKYRIHCFFKSFSVSCKSGKGVQEVKDCVYKYLYQVSMKKEGVIPASWILFQDYLLGEKESGTSYFEWSIYESIASKFKLAGSVLRACSRYLMATGVILHYPFRESSLGVELVVIDPKWLSDLMICFFTTHTTFVKKGILSISDIPNILQDYRTYMHIPLMNLLERFSIIYQMSSGEYLIPSLLPPQIPLFDIQNIWSDILTPLPEQKRVYKFEFLPLGFFVRVIVHLLYLQLVSCKLFWKGGSILSSSNQDALITFDEKEYLLIIKIKTKVSEPDQVTDEQHLLRLIVETTENLLECYYPRLVENCSRLVPCNHCKSDTPYMFTYEECMKAAISDKPFLFCCGIKSLSRCVSVNQLAPDIGLTDIPQIDSIDLKIGDVLGEGSFGIVNKGVWMGKEIAVKTIKLSSELDERPKFREFQQESFIMSNIEHPNLVKLFGITRNPLRMIMEYITEGDLFNLMHPEKPSKSADIHLFSLKFRLQIALDIAKGMQYLQSLSPPIIHRDLRSPNIFIVSLSEDAEVVAKVADFGLARIITKSMRGTLNSWQWLAPEVITYNELDTCEYGLESDVYSFAMILWELLTFQIPFEEYLDDPKYSKSWRDGVGREVKLLNPLAVKPAIINNNLRPTLSNNNFDCSPELKSLIEQCWNADPRKRPNFHDIVFILSMELNIEMAPRIPSNNNNNNNNISQIENSSSNKIYGRIRSPTVVKRMNQPEDPTNLFEFVETLQHIQSIPTPKKFATCMLYTYNSAIWVGFSDGSLSIFHSKTFKEWNSVCPATGQRNTALLHYQFMVWSADVDGCIKVWDCESLKLLKILNHKEKKAIKCLLKVEMFSSSVTGSNYSSGEVKAYIWAVSPRAKMAYAWDFKTLEIVNTVTFNHEVNCLICIGKVMWFGLSSGDIACYNIESCQPAGSWSAHKSPVTSLITVDSVTVWSGTDIGEMKVWKMKGDKKGDAKIYNHCEMKAHLNAITSFSRLGNHICSSSVDHTLILWDAQANKGIQEITFGTRSPIALLSLNHYLWCSVSDTSISIFDYKTLKRDSVLRQSSNNNNNIDNNININSNNKNNDSIINNNNDNSNNMKKTSSDDNINLIDNQYQKKLFKVPSNININIHLLEKRDSSDNLSSERFSDSSEEGVKLEMEREFVSREIKNEKEKPQYFTSETPSSPDVMKKKKRGSIRLPKRKDKS